MRLIDADALIADCQLAQKQADRHGREYANAFYSGGGEISTEWWCVEDMIDNAPTIEPEQRWIPCRNHLPSLRDFPTIEPERKPGRWIFIRPTKEDRLYVACDQCGQVEAWDENCGMLCALVGEKYAHYCPNCGTYMESKE